MTFLSLFSGIGGFDLAAYRCGLRFDRHLFSEIDPYAIKVFQARFPDAEALGDITKIKDLPDDEYIICGGFPCQDISVAGKGAGLAGARSGLWFEMLRLIGDLRPRFVIVENVGALLVRGIDTVLGTLAEIGYDAEWQIISAASVGAPHRRERIYIVAYPAIDHSDSWRPESAGFIRKAGATGRGDAMAYPNSAQPTTKSERAERTQGDISERRRSRGRREWWTTEPNVGRVANGIPSRVDRLKCLGNAIVPQCAEVIFNLPAFDEWRML